MLRKIGEKKGEKKGTGYFFTRGIEGVKKVACPLFTAILLVLAFPNPQISILAWIALTPLFFIIDNSSKKTSFFLSYLNGILFFAGILYWLTYVTVLGYALLVFCLALYFGLFGLFGNILFCKLRGSKMHFLLVFILPSLWVSLEFLRGFLFTGFPWGILGYTQYKNLFLIQIADITGSYGVSFVIVMLNLVIYLYLSCFFKKTADVPALKFQTAVAAIAIASISLYGYSQLEGDDIETGLKLSVAQGNIEQAQKWDPYYMDYIIDRYEDLTKKAANDKPNLIVWPETSVPGFLGEKYIDSRLKKMIRNIDTPLFIGAATYEFSEDEEIFFNSAVLFSPEGDIEKEYRKLHLVPFGEYVPLEKHFPFIRDFIDVPIGDYTAGEEFTIFDIESKDRGRFKYAALICFEDIFPDLVRGFALGGADFLVNITNDAWFEESSEQLQHAQASVFRAVENRVSVLRAANTGFSCYINPKGIIEGAIYDRNSGKMYIHGFKTFALKVSKKNTFYTKYGDIFAYLCLLIVLGTVLTGFSVDFRKL